MSENALEALDFFKEKALIRIVDDDDALRSALRFFLEVDGWKVMDFACARDFLTGDIPSAPGAIILDVRMPGLSGLECQRLLNERGASLPIIFLTAHGDIDMAVHAVQEGAVDFLQKPVDEDRLINSVIKAATKSVRASLGIVPREGARALVDTLTARELDIARLVAANLVSREIAERLGISIRTVEVHRAGAVRKLGVRSAPEIASLLKAAQNE